MSGAAIHWFRKGLRVHDNGALLQAAEHAEHVFPVFIIDPHFAKAEYVGTRRYSFLLEALRDLDNTLQVRYKSRLFVARGKPEDVLPALVKRWNIKKITFEHDTEPYALRRDGEIRNMFSGKVEVVSVHGHTLWNPHDVIKINRGSAPISYTSFLQIANSMPTPASYPDPPALPCDLSCFSEAEFSVPTLEEMGYPPNPPNHDPKFPGGETFALERLRKYIARDHFIVTFEKPNTAPNSLDPSTTVLSPYLKFGCLSSRLFLRELRRVCAGKAHTKPPVSLEGQLMWREFFYTASVGTPNFDRMVGNPRCRQIPWDSDPALLAAWTDAKTGYPFIDAIMTQLRQEGWIHHLARHAVACFLTRGDLWQSWEAGAKVFERLLLDADWAVNSANWQWLSCSCFYYQYFRCYSPIAFGKKTDPEGAYIRKYLPQLRKFPKKYIYQPWEAPLDVQRAAGCIIGKDYPKPIVDHAVVSKANMGRMQAAYAAARPDARDDDNDSDDDDDKSEGAGGGAGRSGGGTARRGRGGAAARGGGRGAGGRGGGRSGSATAVAAAAAAAAAASGDGGDGDDAGESGAAKKKRGAGAASASVLDMLKKKRK